MSDSGEHPGPTYRPSREGLAQVLGKLEAEVMEYVWSAAPRPVSAREVAESVGRARGVQYITLVTVLNNLWRKGLLRREKTGRAFHYLPIMRREDFIRRVSREVFAGVMRLGPEVAVSSFVDVLAEMGPGEIDRLKQKLSERVRREQER